MIIKVLPNKIRIADFVRHLVLGWLCAVTVEFLLLTGDLQNLEELNGLAAMSFGRVLLTTLLVAVILFALSLFVPVRKAERYGIFTVFTLLAAFAVAENPTLAFALACILICAVLGVYAVRGWDGSASSMPAKEKPKKLWLGCACCLTVAFFAFVSAWTVARVLSFCAPTYDFGIFAQMFYNMKESGLPLTTVERDGLLSHFHVHMSPIYYLMLPFYILVPRPETLQVLQAAVIASSVIPLWLIGKQHGLSGCQRTLLCAVLLLLPAFSGGVGYDIHENCFLTPLILWLLWAIDAGKIPLSALFALLTCMVKEDAAMYVAVVGLYLAVRTALRWQKGDLKKMLLAVGLLCGSVAYFFAVTGYLAKIGDGVMTYRYQNFMYDGSDSLLSVVKAVVMSPLKAVFECVDAEKWTYLLQTMVPLLCLPLLTRRYERYILLIPYVLVNLMSDYQYQHHIMFQYNFGSTACLIYLTAVNVADLKMERRQLVALGAAAAVSLGFFASVIAPTAIYYPKLTVQYADYYAAVRAILDEIPENASVSAPTFYTAYLSDRETLYDIRYASKAHILETEYVVLKKSSSGDYSRYNTAGQQNGYDNLVKLLENNGYTQWREYPGVLVIYHRQSS